MPKIVRYSILSASRPIAIIIAVVTFFEFFSSSPAICDDWHYSLQDGKFDNATIETDAKGPSSTTPGRLGFICFPDSTTGLFLEAEIRNPDTLKDFKFEDFEGPDAPYGDHDLAVAKFKSGKNVIVLKSSGAGWYSDSTTFKVSLNLDDLDPKQRSAVRAALNGDFSALEVSLHELKDPNHIVTLLVNGKWNTAPIKRVLESCRARK